MSVPSFNPHSLGGRIAAHQRWALCEDRAAATAPARREFNARFERQVDPDNLLDPAERGRRAEHARRAYFLKLALKSAQARHKARELTAVAEAAEVELHAGGGSDAA